MKREIRVIFIGVALAGAGCKGLQSGEPVFQEKNLRQSLKEYAVYSYWTPEFDENGVRNEWLPPINQQEREMGRRAQEALQEIGTNAIPILLRMLASKEDSDSDLAAAGFHALGEAARPAVPTLTAMLDTNHTLACSALEAIGPAAEEATPALLKEVSLTNGPPALFALRALTEIHGRPDLAVPVLTDHLAQCTHDTTLAFGAVAYITALTGYGEQAKAAVPVIQAFLTAQRQDVRASATNALKRINNNENRGAK